MKKHVHLPFIDSIHRAIKAKNYHLHVILGPRQVGKTTTVLNFLNESYKDKYHYHSVDEVFHGDAHWLLEIWERARKEKAILVIDEIQKCEKWSEVIKKLWDEDKKNNRQIFCILLGSASLNIQKGLSESLTGRFELHHAYHWNFHESSSGYGLSFDQFLSFGGYPGSYPLVKKQNDWAHFTKHSIILTVIEKDILQNQNVKSPSLFKQAFEIIMSYPAQEISYTKLLGQIQDKGNVDLVKYYLSLYEGAFLIKILEKFSGKKILTKSSSPKILPLAPALFYLEVLDKYSSEEKGRVFELIVGAQLVRTGHNLYYWREGNFEVDYVLKYGRRIYAIEVKSGRRKSEKGLLKFKEKYPEAICVILSLEDYPGFENDPMAYLAKWS